MSSIKISQLPQLPSIAANTSNTLFLGVDQPTGITGKFTATTLAEQLYANNALTVGNNIILFSNTVGQLSGYDPTFLQVNMQNFNANGSGDFVITGDKGTNSNNFIDMGLSGSNFQQNPTIGTAFLANDGYMYVQGPGEAHVGNLLIGTATSNTKIIFTSGGLNVENIVGYIDEDGAHFTNLDSEIAANLVASMTYTNTKIAVVNSNNGNTAALAQGAFSTANTANSTAVNAVGQINILQSQLASNANAIVALTGYSQSAYATINTIAVSSNTANLALQTQAAFNSANVNANLIASILVVNSVQNNAINLAIQNTSSITVSHNLTVPGMLTVDNSTFSSNTSAVAITGSTNFARQMPANDGYMLHITGKDAIASRLVVDSYGSNTYSLFTGRSGRGTAGAPVSSGNGDVIARYSSSSYAGNTGFQPLGVGRMDFVATEDHTDTNRGTQIQFYAIQNGSNTLSKILTMDGSTASFTGNLIATNLTVSGNVTGNTTFSNVSVQNQVANTITFYPQYAPPTQLTGQLWFDDSVERLVFDTDIPGDRPGLGRVIYERVYNNTGSTLGQNAVVKLSGIVTTNNIPFVALADSMTYSNSAVSGIVSNPIANGAYGYIYIEGIMLNANTSLWSTGDILYLTQTDGLLSNTAPVNSQQATIQVGKVIVGGNTTSGKVRVELLERPAVNKTNGSVLFANNSLTVASNTLNINEATSTVSINGIARYNVATQNATVAQLTSKTTAVTCNGRTGQITTSNSNLAGNRSASFTVNNSFITSATDVVIVNIASGGSTNSYAVSVTNINAAGSFDVTISNVSGGALAEALVINFAVIRVN